jgi:bifunctional ADP-heptose synthase (sugar kinase/adenylyltransferase)
MSSLREVVPVPRAQLAKSRVLVVGDVMLDRYWFGDVDRISPEAPVPVVHAASGRAARRRGQRRAQRAALGAQAGLCVVGCDEPGERIVELLASSGVTPHLERDAALPPPSSCACWRASSSCCASTSRRADARSAARGLAHFDTLLPQHNVVLMSDYAKGGLTHDDDDRARARRQPVLVDPKGDDWARYRGAR